MLPELPKKHNKKEADFGTDKFRPWALKNNILEGTYELKHTRGENSIPYSELTDEQVNSALRVQSPRGELIKIITSGTIGAPDYVFIKNKTAFVVIKYPKSIEVITINNLLAEKARGKRKSLTWERAKAISTTTIK
jgi:hypothetical protein